jgi:hypothetical protein
MNSTRAIRLNQAQNIIEAHAFAAQIGRPLNRFVTIHWALADGGGDPRKRFARLMELARKWCAQRQFPLCLVYAHEHDRSQTLHTHFLVHMPAGLAAAFDRMLERWIGGAVDTGSGGSVLVSKPGDDGLRWYITKDIEPVSYADLGIPQPLRRRYAAKRSTRPISGKRCGVSQAIGPAARAKTATVTDGTFARWTGRMRDALASAA